MFLLNRAKLAFLETILPPTGEFPPRHVQEKWGVGGAVDQFPFTPYIRLIVHSDRIVGVYCCLSPSRGGSWDRDQLQPLSGLSGQRWTVNSLQKTTSLCPPRHPHVPPTYLNDCKWRTCFNNSSASQKNFNLMILVSNAFIFLINFFQLLK